MPMPSFYSICSNSLANPDSLKRIRDSAIELSMLDLVSLFAGIEYVVILYRSIIQYHLPWLGFSRPRVEVIDQLLIVINYVLYCIDRERNDISVRALGV